MSLRLIAARFNVLHRLTPVLLVACLLPPLRVAGQTTPALLATDDFSYAAGSIVGRDGGSGWDGAWFNPYASNGNPLVINASGQLTFSGGTPINAAGRTLGTRVSGDSFAKAYLLFDIHLGTQSGGGTPTLRIQDTTLPGTEGGIGNNGYTTNFAILGPDLAAGADTGIALSTAAHVLFEIDYTNTVSRLWVGTSAWDINSLPTDSVSATYAFAPSFDRLDLFVRQLNSFDNLQVYTVSAVPEPTTWAAVAGAIALGCGFLRRRRPT